MIGKDPLARREYFRSYYLAHQESRREYNRQRLVRLRQAWLDSNGPCATCGGAENLEVDHIDPATKTASNLWAWSQVRRADELAKCQVLCRDCHKAKSATERSKPLVHGTYAGYDTKGCKCQFCREANAVVSREYRRKKAGKTFA